MSFTESAVTKTLAQVNELKLRKAVKRSRAIAVTIFSLVLLIYAFYYFILPVVQETAWCTSFLKTSDHYEKWGQFGDYVGGILNPVLAFFAFYWLTQSVMIQSVELAATRRALLDSNEAQKKQTKHAAEQVAQAERTAKINGLNGLIATLNTQVSSLESDVRFIMDQYLSGRGESYGFFGPGGERNIDAQRTIALLKKRLEELTKERDQLFMELDALVS